MKICLVVLCSVIISGCSMFGASSVKEPGFQVLEKEGNIELRRYEAMIVARTSVDKPYDQAKNEGFKRLADYIFGNNSRQQKVAMTAPVLQQAKKDDSTKMAMTAPVIQQPSDTGWQTTFVMPDKYTLETLPMPNSDLITIGQVPERTVAVIRFNGGMSTEKMDEYAEQLTSWLLDKGYSSVSEPVMAGYNPPWTLPGLRRNEVMIEVKTPE